MQEKDKPKDSITLGEIQLQMDIKDVESGNATVIKIEKRCGQVGCKQRSKYIIFMNTTKRAIPICLDHLKESVQGRRRKIRAAKRGVASAERKNKH